jgi:uncharacterized membrane protein
VELSVNRYWEIDFLRGFAICMMVFYHILFQINYFQVFNIPLRSLPFLLYAYPIGTLFLLIVGISLTLSYKRAIQNKESDLFYKFFKRGLKIFALGLVITMVTWFFPHEGFIVFGILHCIGLSIILGYFFIRYTFISFIIGILIVFIGILLQGIFIDFYWLFWIGLKPYRFYTLDYFPLLPWFGVVLIGIYIGNIVYQNGYGKKILTDKFDNVFVNGLVYLGRHSLIIYMLHQPIIYVFIFLFFKI